MTRKTRTLFVATVAGGLLSCTHVSDRRIDEKLTQAPEVSSAQALNTEADRSLSGADHVTDDQRLQVFQLRESTRQKLAELDRQENQLRLLLARETVSPRQNAEDFDGIKRRIQDVADQRLEVLFDDADRENKILGHQTASSKNWSERIYERTGSN